jgi:LPXTG-motif cell wall-anchored protein
VNTGVISGTATTAGTYTFDIDATNGGGTSTTAVTFVVTSPPIVVTSATAPTAPTGSAYTYTIPVTGGGAPYTYTVASGSLPSWATLNANGTITGTPTSAGGPTTFRINVTNAVGTTPITVTLSSAVPTSVGANTTITATVNQPSTTTISPGGTGPFAFAVTNGSLPAWATLNTSTGVISGTPTVAGTGSFTVTVSGAYGTASTTVNYTASVQAPTYAATTNVYATETVALNYAFANSGGSNATSFTMGSGLPSSLTFSTNAGTLTGTPALGEAGTYTATMQGSNSAGGNSTTVNLTVLTMPTIASTTSLPASTSGSVYSQPIRGTGTGTFAFTVSNGRLPAGLSINPTTGAITGTPRAAAVGTHTFTITMTNQAGTAVSTVVTMTVKSGASIAATLTAKKAKKGSSYSYTVKPTGNGPFTYRVSSGKLPAGLKLNSSTGKITGTPTASGTYTIGITITGPGGTTLTTRVVLQVSASSSATSASGATPSASASPSVSPSASASASASPSPSSTASGAPSTAPEEPGTKTTGFAINTTWLIFGGVLLALLVGFWWFLVAKRRKDDDEKEA